MGSWPENVGVIAVEQIFPSQYVDQKLLEEYDGVPAGKYTIGLGQERMGFCTDREDIHSLCLTVVHKLLENNSIRHEQIGRLEVGTETILDKSKSVKTVLMQLFEPHGINDIEGIDTTNACYGGTAALFNAINWIESSSWDGRYAIVVAADIAVYAKGPARPTGGAGAVALLIGPNAPLVISSKTRSTYMRHAYDFYKPDLSSEYPTVDGKLSIQCYLQALDECYRSHTLKESKFNTNNKAVLNSYRSYDAICFHSPYCKLVQKSYARLLLNDLLIHPQSTQSPDLLKKYEGIKLNETYFDRDLEKQFIGYTKEDFEKKIKPTLLLANQIGNMYTASVFGGLVSLLISKDVKELAGNKIGMFSYGSGLASSMYSITISNDADEGSPLAKLVANLSHVKEMLDKRVSVTPEDFARIMEDREKCIHKAPYKPNGSFEDMFPGTYYLESVDEMHRRTYKRTPNSTTNGTL